MVDYDEQRPVGALAALVSSTWVQRVPSDAPASYSHRNLPSGGVELRCRIGSTPQVVGPLTGPLVEELPPGTTVVGLRFHPGAAPGALGLPANELVDQVVDVDELFGAGESALTSRLAEAPTPYAALATLQRRLVDRLTDAPPTDPLVDETVRRLRPGGSGNVADIRSSLEISERQLRRRCLAAVGLGPKALHRILRFQGFLALTQLALARGRDPLGEGIAAMASTAGYADQSHLTRECLRITGTTPRSFLGDTTRQCGCGHDHTASYEQLLPASAMAGLFKNAG